MTPTPFTLDAVCVGPQRTASSWLHDALLPHPSLCLPDGVKETMFFDERFDKGLDWYAWHFRGRRSEQRCLEIAPTYFDHDLARERLHAHNAELPVVVLVRNPVARAYSLYRMHLSKGRVRGTFADAIEQMPRIMTSGHYAQHSAAWEQLFGRDRVHYVLQEDAHTDPQKVIADVCAVLGVPAIAPPVAEDVGPGARTIPRYPWLARKVAATATALRARRLHRLVNVGKYLGVKRLARAGRERPASLTPELYADLADRFARDIDFLESRLERDLSSWRTSRQPTTP